MATSGGTSRGRYNLAAAARRRLTMNKGRDNSSFTPQEALGTLNDAKIVQASDARRGEAEDKRFQKNRYFNK